MVEIVCVFLYCYYWNIKIIMSNKNIDLLYWNYFLALENKLVTISNFIELNKDNYKTFSIEIAHLFLSASSEVDVILRELIYKNDKSKEKEKLNIKDFKNFIKNNYKNFIDEKVYINRYNISFQPWKSWDKDFNPAWWNSYNNVKHTRSTFFNEANLENLLFSMGSLLISIFYFYLDEIKTIKNENVSFLEVTRYLEPKTSLIALNENYYYDILILS